MEDLLLTVEKNKFYQELVTSIPEADRAKFIEEVAQMAKIMTGICDSFDDIMQSEEGPDKFMEAMGSAINRRAFYDNNGVTEIPWPEKN
jgi:hypothetical protein